MPPELLEYASDRTPRPPIDGLRSAPFFAALCSVFGWVKSDQYSDVGQLATEQVWTLSYVIVSLVCLAITLARFRRYRLGGRRKLLVIGFLCVVVLVGDALAVWNLSTAKVVGNNRWVPRSSPSIFTHAPAVRYSAPPRAFRFVGRLMPTFRPPAA